LIKRELYGSPNTPSSEGLYYYLPNNRHLNP